MSLQDLFRNNVAEHESNFGHKPTESSERLNHNTMWFMGTWWCSTCSKAASVMGNYYDEDGMWMRRG